MVAVDFSDCSRLAVEWVLERHAGLGVSELVFQHVADPSEVSADEAGALEGAIARVRAFVDGCEGPPLPEKLRPRYAVVRGRPADAIVESAITLNVQLVVTGTNGREGLDRWVLGSVAESVVRHAPCTVLVVRPVPSVPVNTDQPSGEEKLR